MPSNPRRRPLADMEFITIVHPSQKNSPRLKRQAHSHAARAAHARARRTRVAAHTAALDSTSQKDASESSPHPKATVPPARKTKSRNMNLGSYLTIQRLGLHVSSSVPASIPSAFEHEPLASFLKSLTSREHYLFDYCKSSLPHARRPSPLPWALAQTWLHQSPSQN
jgi:hypothetical protein